MKLEGERIYLKPFTKEHASDWVRWTQDEEVTRYSVMRPYTLEEELKFLEEQEKDPNPELIFVIFLKENDKKIGNCGIHKSKNKNYSDKTFTGLIIGEKNEWGKGYGTDVMKTLLKYAKEELGIKELYLNVDIPNISAQKVYEKCGFKIIAKEKASERVNSGGEQYIMQVDLSVIN
jgi:RimJ/RimL family protein N-acetyltransferase